MRSPLLGDEVALPLRPGTATEVLAKLDDPDTSASMLSSLINTEPALVTRLLALANSAFYGRSREISDINQAVVTVGQGSLRALTLGVAMDSLFNDDLAIGDHWWDDAVAVGAGAAVIAPRLGTEGGEAFCAGLLHDIGHVAMALAAPDEWGRIEALVGEDRPRMSELESEIFGLCHAQLGGEILADIGLPASLAKAVGCHHHELVTVAEPLGQAVVIGVAIEEQIRDGGEESRLEAMLEVVGLADLDCAELIAEARMRFLELRALFVS